MQPAPDLVRLQIQALANPEEVNSLEQRHESEQQCLLVIDMCFVDSYQVLNDLKSFLLE